MPLFPSCDQVEKRAWGQKVHSSLHVFGDSVLSTLAVFPFFRNLRKPFPVFGWEKRRERVLMNGKAREAVERDCHSRPHLAADAFSVTLSFLNEDEDWGEGENCPGKGSNKNYCRERCATTNSELEKQFLLPPAPNSPNIYAVSAPTRQNIETGQEDSDIKKL